MSLPAFKVTTASGHSWVTSMAKGITLADAKKYFVGKYFDVGSGDKEKMEKAVSVVEVSSNPCGGRRMTKNGKVSLFQRRRKNPRMRGMKRHKRFMKRLKHSMRRARIRRLKAEKGRNPRRRMGVKTYTTFYPSMRGFVSTVKKGGKHVYDGPARSTRRGAAKAAISEAKRKGYLNPKRRKARR